MKTSNLTNSRLFRTKYGKLLPLLLITGMIVAGTATVFTLYYANVTATVRAPDVQFIAGSDASGSCTKYPCATVSVANNDLATVGVSFFSSGGAVNTTYYSGTTYYTNLIQVKNNGAASHTINSILLNGITATSSANDFGSITVYYCTTQTDNPAGSASCYSHAITSTTSGSITGFPGTLTAGSIAYVEVVAYAGSAASAGDTVQFNIQLNWV